MEGIETKQDDLSRPPSTEPSSQAQGDSKTKRLKEEKEEFMSLD